MRIDNLGRPVFAGESARAFNALDDYWHLLVRSTITKGKAEEVESAIQYALATRERQLDIGFMFLHNRATGNEYSDNPVFHLVRSTPWAVTDDMKIGALEGLIDSLRRLVIERTRIKGEPS